TPRRAPGSPEAAPLRDRLDQLADAMHDEGDLRAMPAAARGSGNGRADLRVLLLQPGPAARQGGFRGIGGAPGTEQRPGKAHRAMDRSLPAAGRAAHFRLRDRGKAAPTAFLV